MKWMGDSSKAIFTADNEIWANLPEYVNELNFTTGGFRWNSTPGSFQLAYSILRTYFEASGIPSKKSIEIAKIFTYHFSEEIVSKFEETWYISSNDIKKWIQEKIEHDSDAIVVNMLRLKS